jgi:Flp pilus assembly protein TadG
VTMSRPGPESAERGAATTQLVLVMPLLLLVVMLILQFGLWYHGSHVAVAAAQEGARAARLEGGTAAEGEARARAFLGALGREVVGEPEVVATRDAEAARVEVRGLSVAVVPGFRLPISAVSEGVVERFRPPEDP